VFYTFNSILAREDTHQGVRNMHATKYLARLSDRKKANETFFILSSHMHDPGYWLHQGQGGRSCG